MLKMNATEEINLIKELRKYYIIKYKLYQYYKCDRPDIAVNFALLDMKNELNYVDDKITYLKEKNEWLEKQYKIKIQ